MAATVEIREFNGVSPGTPTDKTSGAVRFHNVDTPDIDLANPVVRPSSGTAYSYEKWLRFRLGSTGPDGSLTSLRAFSDGADGFPANTDVWAGSNAAYVQSVQTLSTIANSGNLFTYIEASPLSLGAGPYLGTNIDIGSFFVMQGRVESTAPDPSGAGPTETLTFAYDET